MFSFFRLFINGFIKCIFTLLSKVRLFDYGKIKIQLDVIHYLLNHKYVNIEFMIQLIWPPIKRATTGHFIVISSLLASCGFIMNSLMSPECILPLAASCLFSNDLKLAWSGKLLQTVTSMYF